MIIPEALCTWSLQRTPKPSAESKHTVWKSKTIEQLKGCGSHQIHITGGVMVSAGGESTCHQDRSQHPLQQKPPHFQAVLGACYAGAPACLPHTQNPSSPVAPHSNPCFPLHCEAKTGLLSYLLPKIYHILSAPTAAILKTLVAGQASLSHDKEINSMRTGLTLMFVTTTKMSTA